MLKHFIYPSSSKPATSPLCSLYYRYSSELSSSFCILSFLVRATSIDQTFYSATHYLAAVWLDSRHGPNMRWQTDSYMKKAENSYHFFFHPQVVTSGTLLLTKVSIFVTRTVIKQADDVHTQTECQHALVSHWLSQWHRQTRQDHSRPDSCDLMSLCTKQMIDQWLIIRRDTRKYLSRAKNDIISNERLTMTAQKTALRQIHSDQIIHQ